jgi:hypothetical protein
MSQALRARRSKSGLRSKEVNVEQGMSNVEVMATEDTETTEQPRITKTRNKEMLKRSFFSRFVLSGFNPFYSSFSVFSVSSVAITSTFEIPCSIFIIRIFKSLQLLQSRSV